MILVYHSGRIPSDELAAKAEKEADGRPYGFRNADKFDGCESDASLVLVSTEGPVAKAYKAKKVAVKVLSKRQPAKKSAKK